jgi:GNAT superfamily N-acetyltransferase
VRHSYLIRKAELRDAEALAAGNISMAQETERRALDPRTALLGAKAIIKDQRKGFYLVAAKPDGTVLGQLLVTFEWSDWRNRWFWWIQSVYVLPEHRRLGIFRALYQYVWDTASFRKDVAGLRLYVDQGNNGAQAVYETLGMVRTPYQLFEVDVHGGPPGA